MLDTVQLVGYGNRDHVVIDGGLRACVTGEVAGDRCDIDRPGDVNQRGRLLHISDMMDQRAREDNAFHDGQPNWYGIGSRNLFANFTLLRGGYRNAPGISISSSMDYLNSGRRTAIRLLDVRARHFFASQAHGVLEAFDADIFEQMQVQDCRVVAHFDWPTRLTMAANHFQGDVGASSPNAIGVNHQVNNGWLDVRNSTFTNNTGAGLMTWHAWWCTRVRFHRSRCRATRAAGRPVIVANNILRPDRHRRPMCTPRRSTPFACTTIFSVAGASTPEGHANIGWCRTVESTVFRQRHLGHHGAWRCQQSGDPAGLCGHRCGFRVAYRCRSPMCRAQSTMTALANARNYWD